MTERYTHQKTDIVYKGKVINLKVDTVTYKGKTFQWEIVDQGEAAVIVPYMGNDQLLLIHQYRHSIGEYLWEFPAGRCSPGETIETCAVRELKEECGYHCRTISKVLTYYPSPGVCNEILHLFMASDLVAIGDGHADFDEIIHPKIISAQDVGKMILSGEIKDAKTILGYLYFERYNKDFL